MKIDFKGLSEAARKLVGKYKFVVIIAAAGIFLMLIPSFTGDPQKTADAVLLDHFDLQDYESKLEQILGLCRNVGRVRVMLTLDSTMESVYAQEKRNNTTRSGTGDVLGDVRSDSESSLSIVSGGSGVTQPVTIKQIYPRFSGALVVCDGADMATVRLEVVQAVASLTGLSSTKITIIKMKE